MRQVKEHKDAVLDLIDVYLTGINTQTLRSVRLDRPLSHRY